MELPHIGLTCSVCNRNDYLPFKCTSCAKVVCIDHRANHGADCPLTQTSFVAEPKAVSESLKQACNFCRKITLKLELSRCQHCPGNHCLYHRHQVQHECPQLARDKLARDQQTEIRLMRQQEALNRLKATVGEAGSRQQQQQQTKNQVITDPKKSALAKRVRLMKMKQSATCPKGLIHDTSIQTDQDKLFLEVRFVHEPQSELSQESLDGKSVNIWTSPKWTVGQTLDYPAHLLGATNKNHLEGSDRLVLMRHSRSTNKLIDLDTTATFQQYLDTKELESGDILLLTYARGALQSA